MCKEKLCIEDKKNLNYSSKLYNVHQAWVKYIEYLYLVVFKYFFSVFVFVFVFEC